MKSKRGIWLATAAMAMTLVAGGAAFAEEAVTPEASLKKFFPNLPYKSVKPTDVDGLFEVVVEGNVLYFAPKTGHLVFGELFTKEGRNLTAETKELFAAEKIKLVTEEDKKAAVKVGNGKHIVIEVTDPDCPYCRRLHEYWKTRPDVTRYVFFLPLAMHPDAEKKSRYVLAAKDQEKALEEVYSGKLDKDTALLAKQQDDKGLMNIHKAVAAKLQIQSTPMFWLNGQFIKGANTKQVESLIGVCKQSGEKGAVAGGEESCGK